ncbi:MAG: hypothetical protein ACE5I9_08675 [Candidatus Methylomirabilales bacterium]
MTPEEIKRHVGKWVTLRLAPQAPGGPTVTGHLVGTLDAADGLVVQVEPEGSQPGTRLTLHYHHIMALTPAGS